MVQNLIAPITANSKLGTDKAKGIIVATNYRPVGDAAKGAGTCPSTCALLDNGCYTKKFLVNQNQKRSVARNDDLNMFLSKGANFVRLHTSGDFFKQKGGTYVLDVEYLNSIIEFAKDNPSVIVWTYTHDVTKLIDKGYNYNDGSFPDNLHITASCDTIEQTQYARKYGYRTARVITAISDSLSNETLCPYDKALHDGLKPSVTCAKCTLCFNKKHKKDIAFLKH